MAGKSWVYVIHYKHNNGDLGGMFMTMYNEMGSFKDIQEEINGWSVKPVRTDQVEPMEAIKRSAGYAVEQHQWTNYHHLSEMTSNKETKELFAKISFQEEEHQALMGSLEDPEISPVEASLATEMAAIQGFADAAQLETDATCKMVYDYILVDHLTQTKALADVAASIDIDPEEVFKGHMEPMEGRPFEKQFIPTSDLQKQPLDKNTADVASLVNLHTLLANEESLRNSFHMIRKMLPSQGMRRLYNMVTAVENIHVTMLGSLHDPSITPLEYAMINELMEIRAHRMGMEMAENENAKKAHEYAYKEDMQHLSWLRDAYAKEGGDASKFEVQDKLFAMPKMSAMDYIKQILEAQMNMVPRGTSFEQAA